MSLRLISSQQRIISPDRTEIINKKLKLTWLSDTENEDNLIIEFEIPGGFEKLIKKLDYDKFMERE